MKLFFLLTKKPISTPVVHLERAPFDRDTFLKQSINVFFFFFLQEKNYQKRDGFMFHRIVVGTRARLFGVRPNPYECSY